MRFSSFATLAAFCSLALAQNPLSGLQPCARDCLTDDFGGCALLDVKCICGNKNLIDNLSCCVSKNCNADQQQETIKFAHDICVANGVTVPTVASCAATAASTGTASAASVSSSVSSGSVTSAPSGSSASTTPTAAGNSASSSAGPTGAAALPTIGAGLGLGVAMAGVLAAF
ncbi:hypothetical protein GQ43DRAFT_473008 [Delitschia confertaspora ATCC 74209]|uniref:CFEM domain-containing protein n=1 Tax=Delitschia confertaspora ATCC 74209 TaxID=1513339 RepID=A0A9P4MRP4_9PLEO|nr:hypothetical protein GQ43DRAFT_473008 [Delitschia confertaspora ATCC 74209]